MSALKQVLNRRLFRHGGMLGPEDPRGILNSSNALANVVRMQNGGYNDIEAAEMRGATAPIFGPARQGIYLGDAPSSDYFPSSNDLEIAAQEAMARGLVPKELLAPLASETIQSQIPVAPPAEETGGQTIYPGKGLEVSIPTEEVVSLVPEDVVIDETSPDRAIPSIYRDWEPPTDPDVVVDVDVPDGAGTAGTAGTAVDGKELLRTDVPVGAADVPNAIDTVAEVVSDPDRPMEEKENLIAEYIQEFIDIVPGYEGKTQFEKGMDWVTFGGAIMAGRSQHAIQNIGDALLAVGDRFTTDDKERRAYKTAIDLSAAKYGMARINEIRTQRRADERAFTSFVANEPVRIDGIDYGEGDSVLLSTAFLVKHGRVPKGLTAEDLAVAENKAVATRSNNLLSHITAITKNQQLDPAEAKAWTEQYASDRDNVYTSNEMLDGIDKLIEGVTFEGDKIFGVTGAWKSLMEKLQASVGMTDDKKWTLQQWNSQLAQVLNRGIGMTLRENQSANSISNKDVEWYVQAYFNGLGIDPTGDGRFSFTEVFKNPAPLFNRLNDLRDQIEAKRSSSLAGLDSIENQLMGRTTRQLERIDAATLLPIYKPGMSLIVPLRGTDVSDRWATEIEPLRRTSASRVHKGFTMTQSPEYGAVWTRNKGNSG